MTNAIKKNKKAVSIMIGYVLLVAIAVIMSIIIYNWVKTYVPRDTPNCPEGVSLMIKKISCLQEANGNYNLSVVVKNNGLFDIGGYYIRATNSSDQELATIDLSKYGEGVGGMIRIEGDLGTKKQKESNFTLSPLSGGFISEFTRLYSIEIIPIRWQEINNKKKLVTCGDAKIREKIICPPE